MPSRGAKVGILEVDESVLLYGVVPLDNVSLEASI